MDDHKLFVGNMAARITQRDLWRFFAPYGPIDECAKFHESFAFVRFVHAADARQARRETHGVILKGRKLKVEFAAAVNKTISTPWYRQGYLYIQPLRRANNATPPKFEQPVSPPPNSTECQHVSELHSPRSDDHTTETRSPSGDEELFLTPDLLRLAGIPYSSSDEGFTSDETHSSPILTTSCDSRFFPILDHRHANHSGDAMSIQNDRQYRHVDLMSIAFARTRLFSEVSSGYGDDSHYFNAE